MTNGQWKTTVTGGIAWVAGISAALSVEPTLKTYFESVGLGKAWAVLGPIAIISGVLNSYLQRTNSVSDQAAGVRFDVLDAVKVKGPAPTEPAAPAAAKDTQALQVEIVNEDNTTTRLPGT